MRTRATQDKLSETLWPSVRRAVLALLLMNSDQECHLREFASREDAVVALTASRGLRDRLSAWLASEHRDFSSP